MSIKLSVKEYKKLYTLLNSTHNELSEKRKELFKEAQDAVLTVSITRTRAEIDRLCTLLEERMKS